MKPNLSPLAVALLIFSAAGLARANEVPIRVLVDEALAGNPELSYYKAQIESARADRKTAAARPNPEAEFELGRKQTRPKDSSLSEEGAAWAVSVSQSFDWPNRLTLRKAIAQRQIELAEIGLAQFQRELAGEVRRAAFRLLVAQEKGAAARQASARGEELIQVLVQREPAGASPLLERRIIEASILTLKHRANEAAKEAETARLDLNQLRGRPIAGPLRIAATALRFPDLEDAETFVGLARTNSFEIRSKVVELEQQGLKIELAQNERYPSFTVRPFFSQEDAADREQTAGIGVSVPLPLWNRNQGNIAAAKSRHAQAEASLLVTQRQVEKELRENLARYAIDQREISQWPPGMVQQWEEAATLADRHYRLGSVAISTYVEMQEKYLEAAETILETQAAALQTLQNIERLTGVPLGNVAGAKEQP